MQVISSPFPIFIPNTTAARKITSSPSADEFFILTMANFLTTLHGIVMKSWKQYSEARGDQAQENTRDHRAQETEHHRNEASRLTGERKQIEALQQSPTEAVHETDKFRFHQGMHISDSDRHLNLPV